MKLGFETIKEITIGASRITYENRGVHFFRFTEEEEELYKTVSSSSYLRTFATSGIKLAFKTDSKKLFLKIFTSPATSRRYFSVDILVNGEHIGYIDNFGDGLPTDYTAAELPLGEFSGAFSLGEGIKEVCVHLPWSTKTSLEEISIDDCSFVEPLKPGKKILAYGDSITHGYDALRPSGRYIARLADALCAEEINKAIGGECFLPRLAELKNDIQPDYVTVAYGTNDWGKRERNEFYAHCRGFFAAMSKNYPCSKIFAITPIWRRDFEEIRKFGKFLKIDPEIRRAVADLPNVTVISGFDLVPKDEKYFADFRLHPNDVGFFHYFEGLKATICK